jgi:enamine deaminase RidA (YjgF/YER057c/UK114 family)
MKKLHAWPRGHWGWPIEVSHKHGVRSGQMMWVGGQVDLTSRGEVNHAGDLASQVPCCVVNLGGVLEELGGDFADLVKLLCFYVNDGSLDERRFVEMVAAALPSGCSPAVTAIPVPYLAYPGMVVEIEAYAMRGEDGRKLPRQHAPREAFSPLPEPFVPALRCGKMMFVSGQSPAEGYTDIVGQTRNVMEAVGRALAAVGADFDDVVKVNRWYVGQGTVEDFEPAALACAAYFREPGPAATGIPLPRHARAEQLIKIEVVAMRGEDGARLPRRHAWPPGLWDWTIHLPYKHGLKCHDMIFLGGQVSLDKQGRAVHPGDLALQTRQAMVHIGTILEDLGADYGDVCKIIAVYQGRCGEHDLHDNLAIRSSFFADPGPATTGVPLPKLAYPDMVIEIDAFAMTDPD